MDENRQDKYKQVFDHAVKLLSMRLHTRHELARKLLQRKYEKDYVEQVLNRLTELKVLNDEHFAEIFLDNLIRFKTFGFYGLKMKLLQRGVPQALIENLLAENLDIDTETKIARRLIGKKNLEKDKLIASLKRKGFRSEVVYKMINE